MLGSWRQLFKGGNDRTCGEETTVQRESTVRYFTIGMEAIWRAGQLQYCCGGLP